MTNAGGATGADRAGADVMVIGGGPAGYVAAIRAAQLGGRVILVEKDQLGGACLNRGCIPTKSLLKSTEYALAPQEAAEMGVDLEFVGINLNKMRERKERVVDQLVRGVHYLVKKNRIELVPGTARFVNAAAVEVTDREGRKARHGAGKIIIASGSKPAPLPVPGSSHPLVLTAEAALNLESIPPKVVIVGGGAIGVEFACIYRNLGADVTLVEMMTQILPQMDADVVGVLANAMRGRGIKIHTGVRVERIEETAGGLAVLVSTPQGALKLEAGQVLAASGRAPDAEGLDLPAAGVKTERGRIVVNARMETGVPGIYAAGDVTGGILLAHVASAEGMVAAENAMGQETAIDYKVVPGCIYSSPEVAGVGLTEKEARDQGYQVQIGKFPFSASGKAIAVGATAGLAKIVADARFGEILGVHLAGERATDLIAEAALAMRLEATVDEIMDTIHAHPTMAETLMEAAHAVHGRSIHLP